MDIRSALIPCAVVLGACAEPARLTVPMHAIPQLVHAEGPHSGQWQYERGLLSCDGYLTRNESEGFCSPQPPRDWRAFEFRGETYYAHRLSDGELERSR